MTLSLLHASLGRQVNVGTKQNINTAGDIGDRFLVMLFITIVS